MLTIVDDYNFVQAGIKPCGVLSHNMKYTGIIDLVFPEDRGKGSRRIYYGLLQHLSNKIEKKIILDLGTHLGHSAYILGENRKNLVITYDIVMGDYISEKQINNVRLHCHNIRFVTQDCLKIPLETLKKSYLIFLDFLCNF